ncbi:MAG: hypothetical protein U0M12_02195 [Acutalibacteraceae bacterium]|nr:hypothetical protein [Acutalibacteraceae bacterium]
MVNFYLMLFLGLSIRKILCSMLPQIMNNIEKEISAILYSVVEFLYCFAYFIKGILEISVHTLIGFIIFLADISAPTKTEKVFLDCCKANTKKQIFIKTYGINQSEQNFRLLDFDTVEYDDNNIESGSTKVA